MLERAPTVVRSDVAEISLGHGRVAVVDIADLPLVGDIQWWAMKNKNTWYAVGSKSVLLHRVIMGNPTGIMVDHINGDGLDNRRANLRVCSNAQNTMNQRKRGGLSSRFKGVTARGAQWEARIEKDGRTVYLGTYSSEEIAAKQYDRAARLMFGSFAKTNAALGLLAA